MRSLWTERRSNFKGRYYQLSDAPLDPKPVQSPHPELMIGGGGERVTLRIVARHADHWNVWGGPQVVSRKGKILDEHCASVGRDPKTITRSVNMALLITDKKAEIEALAKTIETRMGRHAADARDTCLAGTPDQIREQLQQLQGRRRQRPLHPDPVPPAAGAAPRPRPLHRGDRAGVPLAPPVHHGRENPGRALDNERARGTAYGLMPSAAIVSLAAFSASAVLPCWHMLAICTAWTLAWAAVASNRWAVAALIALTHLLHSLVGC